MIISMFMGEFVCVKIAHFTSERHFEAGHGVVAGERDVVLLVGRQRPDQ